MFAYHFVVADADMQRDTNNNLEVIARLIDDMYQKYGALPLAINVMQDTHVKGMDNHMMLKYGVKMVP